MADDLSLFEGENKTKLEAVLPDYLAARRWFGGKARTIASVALVDVMPLAHDEERSYMTILRVNYADGGYQHYVLPLSVTNSDAQLTGNAHQAIVTRIVDGQADAHREMVLYDATFNTSFTLSLLDAIERQDHFSSPSGEITAWRTHAFDDVVGDTFNLEPSLMGAEQSNTSIKYGNRFILKLFRRLEEGTSPDLEVGRFLGKQGFTHTPALAGALEYLSEGEPVTLAILQGFVRNFGDAWSLTLGELRDYYRRTASDSYDSAEAPPLAQGHPLRLANMSIPEETSAIGDYMRWSRLLGRRTAEMHIALASDPTDPAFAPEPYTPEYQRAMYNSMNALTEHAFGLLRSRLSYLHAQVQEEGNALLARQAEVQSKFGVLLERPLAATRTRCHGDYHLGQVLYTGRDFMIIDFEGEPVRSLAERRLKHSPLKDVAGMLRSFHYAAYSGMFSYQQAAEVKNLASLEPLADAWQQWVSVSYLREYLQTAGGASFLPQNRKDLQVVLDAHLLEKAVYELIYELNNRPGWVMIPLKGILSLLV